MRLISDMDSNNKPPEARVELQNDLGMKIFKFETIRTSHDRIPASGLAGI